MRARLRAASGDDGSITLLSIGAAVLALALVLTVVAATAVHLERKRLLALADGAALAAAAALDRDAYYVGQATGETDGSRVVLTDRSVEVAVVEHLADAPEAERLTGLRVVEASTPDGRTAQVRLAALVRPPLLTSVTAPWSDGITVEVATSARAG